MCRSRLSSSSTACAFCIDRALPIPDHRDPSLGLRSPEPSVTLATSSYGKRQMPPVNFTVNGRRASVDVDCETPLLWGRWCVPNGI